MKVSRQALKGIIKECLIEILAEGIGESGKSHLAEASARAARAPASVPVRQQPRPQQMLNPVSQGMIKNVRMGTTDLSSILKDTETTTLPFMNSQPDPEAAKASIREQMMGRSGGFTPPSTDFDPGYDSTPQFEQPSFAPSQEVAFSPPSPTAWEAMALGKASDSGLLAGLRLQRPPEPPKLSAAFLDQKVG